MSAPVQSAAWARWAGGDCPFDPRARIAVRFRCGETWGAPGSGSLYEAGSYDWRHGHGLSDIIAYRVVKP